MENELFDTASAIDLRNLTKANLASPPNSCSGNACEVIDLSATFNPGTTMVRTITVRNTGSKAIKVSMDWADFLGTCNVTTNTVQIAAGGSTTFQAPGPYNPGYCRIRSNFI